MKNQIKLHILTFFDYVSAIPITIYIALLYQFILSENISILFLFFEMLYVDRIVVPFIKNQPYPDYLKHITDRPQNAQRCDYLSREPLRNKAGFPSGHMTVTAMFAVYQICDKFIQSGKLHYDIHLFIHIMLIVTMGFARYYKQCHNVIQILVGTMLGTAMGYLAFCLNNNL